MPAEARTKNCAANDAYGVPQERPLAKMCRTRSNSPPQSIFVHLCIPRAVLFSETAGRRPYRLPCGRKSLHTKSQEIQREDKSFSNSRMLRYVPYYDLNLLITPLNSTYDTWSRGAATKWLWHASPILCSTAFTFTRINTHHPPRKFQPADFHDCAAPRDLIEHLSGRAPGLKSATRPDIAAPALAQSP